MAVIDSEGRLFGRVNLVDAMVVLAIVVLIPVAYGAYLLFRTPPAKLINATVTSPNAGADNRLVIWGENLRPFMRVSLNDVQAKTFLISSTGGAEADLPPMAPGVYDVVLYDYAQELDRLPKKITLASSEPALNMRLDVVGAFVGLASDVVPKIVPGLKLPASNPTAEVLSVDPPRGSEIRIRAGATTLGIPLLNSPQLPATIRVQCYLISDSDGSLRCNVPGPPQPTPAVPDAFITFRAFGTSLSFQIAEVHTDAAPLYAEAHVRLLGSARVLANIAKGDADDGGAPSSSGTRAAVIVDLGPSRAPAGGLALIAVEDPRYVDVTIRLPVEGYAGGWFYRSRPVKAGAPFSFATTRYTADGTIVSVTFPEKRPVTK